MAIHKHLVLGTDGCKAGEIIGLALPAEGGTGTGTAATVLNWGSGAVGSSTTTRYLYPGYSDRLAEVEELGLIVPRAGTLQNLYVLQNNPKGNGNNLVYTVRVNSSDTLLVVTLASTSSIGSNTTNTVSVSAGDVISIKVSKPLSVGQSPRNISATLEFV